ncbi:MAG TPA: type II toxin-antitoxin system RelE/ParE family toxin [Halanaerobiales bacterium]|nr:type II toxin-antitoxin system RelE/ParE family toxin [Halanaerobiales bacterium]
MNRYDIEITEPAEKDLYEIGRYIAKELLEQDKAVDVVDKIANNIYKLEEMPFRNAIVDDDKLASQGIRKFIVDNYIVFYNVNEENKVITIIRILYNRRDWLNIL